ncbi:MAG: type II toxin-antitoxin system RelE/ParE family toxin [Candidatus Colwellbacteria bacterium]|nr:type II toxin-antitoxin system RelE/ParE family toxin [Candidatus Colwellbacteria bacterium]
MKIQFASQFERSYAKIPSSIKKAFDRKLVLLLKNIRHPSLRAKKYDEIGDIWQARVNRDYRFYFQIEDDTYKIISIIPHP